jgi:polysaccharide pyruvyl transferase WcaK-like protein
MASTLLIGSYGTGNSGDEAILAGMKRLLSETMHHGETLVVFSQDPEETCFLHGMTARRKNPADLLLAKKVIIGGGQLIQDLGDNALKYSLIGLLAKVLGKHVSYHAIGVSLIASPAKRFLVRLGLSLADEISVRDPVSKNHLNNLGVRKEVHIVEDPSIYMEPASLEEANQILRAESGRAQGSEFTIGLTTQHIFDRESDRLLSHFLLTFLRRLLAKHSQVRIVFVPFNSNKDIAVDQDIIFGKWLERRLDSTEFSVIEGKHRPQAIKAIFKLFDLVISVRLHPLLFAWQLGIPAIGVCIDEKIEAFCKYRRLPIVRLDEFDRLWGLVEREIQKRRHPVLDESLARRHDMHRWGFSTND